MIEMLSNLQLSWRHTFYDLSVQHFWYIEFDMFLILYCYLSNIAWLQSLVSSETIHKRDIKEALSFDCFMVYCFCKCTNASVNVWFLM